MEQTGNSTPTFCETNWEQNTCTDRALCTNQTALDQVHPHSVWFCVETDCVWHVHQPVPRKQMQLHTWIGAGSGNSRGSSHMELHLRRGAALKMCWLHMELASNLLVPGTVYGLNSEACPHGRKLSVLFKGNFISLTKHMEIFKETGKFFCTNLTLPKYKEKLCFPLRFVRWSSYFEISCDKNVNEDSSSYVPNTAAYQSKTLNKMGNLDLYLHAIIFDRFITFSYQIRSPPATLRLA